MRPLIVIRRVVFSALGAALALGLGVIAVLAHPEPLYRYHVEEGRLELFSDKPFDERAGRAVLDDVEARLDRAPAVLADPDTSYRIFVTNAPWRKRLVFLWNAGAAGVNYHPLTGVFIRQSDIDHDRVLKNDGAPVAAPRTLAYYAAHEIGHSLVARHIGTWANRRLPAWQREGMADYIGMGGKVDVDALTEALRAGDPDLDPKKTGNYARYRLLTAFFIDHEGWPVDRLLSSNMPLGQADAQLLVAIPPKP